MVHLNNLYQKIYNYKTSILFKLHEITGSGTCDANCLYFINSIFFN